MSQTSSGGHREEASESVFECRVCGTRRATASIPYDRLGYPVCPVCACGYSPMAVA